MIEPAASLRLTAALLGCWGLLTALQGLADRRSWEEGRALGWDLQRLRRSRWLKGGVPAALWSSRGITGLLLLQLVSALTLLVIPALAALVVLYLSSLLLALRFGPDGGDKLALVVCPGAILVALGLALPAPSLILAGTLWTGGQLTIAYFASGASKLIIPQWRSAEALRAALTSYSFGNGPSAAVVRSAPLARVIAWAIMLIEALFPLALLLPFGWLCAVLALALLFHLAIAVVMGLNTYPLAFLAAYPSTLLLSQFLRGAIGWN